jgi:hypothetical protein
MNGNDRSAGHCFAASRESSGEMKDGALKSGKRKEWLDLGFFREAFALNASPQDFRRIT